MPNADTRCTVRGDRRPKGREHLLCLSFSCLAIKREFYFSLLVCGLGDGVVGTALFSGTWAQPVGGEQ